MCLLEWEGLCVVGASPLYRDFVIAAAAVSSVAGPGVCSSIESTKLPLSQNQKPTTVARSLFAVEGVKRDVRVNLSSLGCARHRERMRWICVIVFHCAPLGLKLLRISQSRRRATQFHALSIERLAARRT